ncbi:hypothetical protein V8G54_037534 [Vigna mungo]|uniref:Uncharacterized protein n=1 Tax=Vigna mungo TaxID=3915 RepID=A0AAQ3RHK6_VIGMU
MYFDPDKWSYFVVVCVVKGATHMVNLAKLNGQVYLYVVHIMSQPDVIHMIEYNVNEGGEEVEHEMHEGGECVVLDERTKEDDGGVTEQLDEGVGGECERIKVDVGEVEVDEGDDVEGERIQDDEAHDERTKANSK